MKNLLKLDENGAHLASQDHWTLIREHDGELPPGPLILPLKRWLERQCRTAAPYEPARRLVRPGR